jgi:hypothetical protein
MVQYSKKNMLLYCKILLIVQETSLWVLYGSKIKNKNFSSQYKTVHFIMETQYVIFLVEHNLRITSASCFKGLKPLVNYLLALCMLKKMRHERNYNYS